MNFKSMLLSLGLLTTIICNQAKAITPITSDAQFQAVISSSPQVIIGAGYEADMRVGILVNQLIGISQGNDFPGATYAYAFIDDIPQSAYQYSIGLLCVVIFKNGNLAGTIPAPLSTASLIAQIKQYLGLGLEWESDEYSECSDFLDCLCCM